jgi:hypothetical protein
MKLDDDMSLGEEEVAFFFEIGRALAQWAHIEGQLRRIVGLCVSPVDALTMSTGFLAIEAFHSKLDFCDQVIRRKFSKSEDLIADWDDLYRKLERRARTRNQLAHRKAAPYIDGDVGRRWGLVAWLRDKEDRPYGKPIKSKAPSSAYCLAAIITARREFHAMTTSLSNFAAALDNRPKPFPKSLEQVDGAPAIRDTRNQIRAALGLPRLPSRQ